MSIWIPFNEFWKLNETVTFRNSSCGSLIIDGDNGVSVGFDDVISSGCFNRGCVFETDQTFSVAEKERLPLTQVFGKNCVGMTHTQCQSQPAHTGWHVRATNSTVTVTDNP